MISEYDEYTNSYIERKSGGSYEGELYIEGIKLSPITGVLFKQDGETYLWLKRKTMLVYNPEQQCYIPKAREPRWEAYLKKNIDENNSVAFSGEFSFMMFRFSIKAFWDAVYGREKQRLNIFIDRLPMEQQTIINGIRKRRENEN